MISSDKKLKSKKQNERGGGEADEGMLYQKFTLIVSSIVSLEVDGEIFFELGKIIQGISNRRRFVCELLEIHFVPMILRGDGLRGEDSVRNRRGRKMYEVHKNVDYETWKKARKPKRVKLAKEFFKSAVESIPDRNLSSENKAALISMIDSAVARFKKPGRLG